MTEELIVRAICVFGGSMLGMFVMALVTIGRMADLQTEAERADYEGYCRGFKAAKAIQEGNRLAELAESRGRRA